MDKSKCLDFALGLYEKIMSKIEHLINRRQLFEIIEIGT